MVTGYGQWSNRDNKQFYEACDHKSMTQFAKRCGLETCPDLALILPILHPADHVLEVGAGYGRVLDALLANGMTKITAIERSKTLFHVLEEKYAGQVELYCHDILKFRSFSAFNAILMMWTVISDFSYQEQQELLQHLCTMMGPNAIMVIETFSHQQQPVNASVSWENQAYKIYFQDTVLSGYSPERYQLEQMANQVGLKLVEHLPYLAKGNVARELFVFSNLLQKH